MNLYKFHKYQMLKIRDKYYTSNRMNLNTNRKVIVRNVVDKTS